MTKNENFHENSDAVQVHLSTLQSVIQRMSANSSSSKAWCITIVSAILLIMADKDEHDFALIAVMPITLFIFLDTYYLALEKGFRNSYNEFIEKLHNRKLVANDLYAVIPTGSLFKNFWRSILSFSVWPIYLTMIGMIYFIKFYVLTSHIRIQ